MLSSLKKLSAAAKLGASRDTETADAKTTGVAGGSGGKKTPSSASSASSAGRGPASKGKPKRHEAEPAAEGMGRHGAAGKGDSADGEGSKGFGGKKASAGEGKQSRKEGSGHAKKQPSGPEQTTEALAKRASRERAELFDASTAAGPGKEEGEVLKAKKSTRGRQAVGDTEGLGHEQVSLEEEQKKSAGENGAENSSGTVHIGPRTSLKNDEVAPKGRSSKLPGSARKGIRNLGGAFTAEVFDGSKLKSLLRKDEKEFDAFLGKYFMMLDQNLDGSLSQDELKPALLKFGELVGMPPPGSATEVDKRVEEVFSSVFAGEGGEDIDKGTFVNVTKNFLSAVAEGLQEKPLVMHVYDGRILKELAENEELFDTLADDFFTEFDVDNSGSLTRNEIEASLVALGLVPPSGSKPEIDALLARIMGKYAGADMELQRDEFRALLKDLLHDLSDEVSKAPMVLHSESLPVLSATDLRRAARNPERLRSFSDAAFDEWDTLRTGRLALSDVQKGVKELFQAYGASIDESEVEPTMNLFKCLFHSADADDTGFIERDEFDSLMSEVLLMLAERLEKHTPGAAAGGASTTASWMTDWFYSNAEPPSPAKAKGGQPHGEGSPSVKPEPGPKTTSPPRRVAAASPDASSPGAPATAAFTSFWSSTASAPPPPVSAAADVPGRARTAAEIKAAYNYKPSEAVLKAREKLEQRQVKLREMADKTEQLDADAAEFDDLAAQLAQKMKSSWW